MEKIKILLLGSDMNVYYMARCYNEEYGEKAYVLGKRPIMFTYASHMLNMSYNDNLRDPECFADVLINYYKEHFTKDDKVLLVPCHDMYVRLVVENRDKLSKYYKFNCPKYDIMDSFLVKEKFYETYKNSGLDFPNTYFYEIKDELKIPKNFRYPLILKPGDGIEYNRHHFPNQAKVYRLNTLEEVESVVNEIRNSGYTGNLIIQEYIDGDDTNLFDCVFYVNSKGKAEVATFAQIGLQEHTPTGLGNCTVLINNYNQYGGTMEMINKFKKFLEKVGYNGFCEFDMKYDPIDKKFKVLEINPRQARSSYYLKPCGCNLVKRLIDDLFYNKENEFEFLDKVQLLSMVPKVVIKSQIKNLEYKNKVLELWKDRVDTLTYSKDMGFKRWLYLNYRKFTYVKKYYKFKW